MPFIRIYLNNKLQRQIEIGNKSLTLGRSEDNDIRLNSSGVSSHHAVIRPEGKEYIIEDTGSTNGVFVNDQKIRRHKLKFWDEIQIYNYVLKFMASARPQKETDGDKTERLDENETLVTSVKSIQELHNLKKLDEGFLRLLEEDGTESVHELGDEAFTIGKSAECDLRVHRWLGPDVSCRIERKGSNYYVSPTQRGRVNLNGALISEQYELSHNDILTVDGLHIRFQQITYQNIQQT